MAPTHLLVCVAALSCVACAEEVVAAPCTDAVCAKLPEDEISLLQHTATLNLPPRIRSRRRRARRRTEAKRTEEESDLESDSADASVVHEAHPASLLQANATEDLPPRIRSRRRRARRRTEAKRSEEES